MDRAFAGQAAISAPGDQNERLECCLARAALPNLKLNMPVLRPPDLAIAVDPPFGATNAYIEMAFMHVWARDRLQAAGAVRMSRVILEVHAAIRVNAKQAIDGSAFDLSLSCM